MKEIQSKDNTILINKQKTHYTNMSKTNYLYNTNIVLWKFYQSTSVTYGPRQKLWGTADKQNEIVSILAIDVRLKPSYVHDCSIGNTKHIFLYFVRLSPTQSIKHFGKATKKMYKIFW